jgi:hypothetical protein|tara:strand:+ start:3141 stop:3422 length:282 start_codon:yes stop_codon:yes gene_type:complete
MDMRDLIPYGIAFVVLAVTLSVGAQIIGTTQSAFITDTKGCNATDITACGSDYTVAGNGLTAVVTLSSWQNIIAITLAAAVIIGGLLLYFRFK